MKKKFIINKLLYYPLIAVGLLAFFLVAAEMILENRHIYDTEEFIKKEYGSNEIGVIEKILENREGCMVCHRNMTGFSVSHLPAAIGCTSCHLGDPLTLDKEKAHEGMALVPGNMDTVSRTCGRSGCHPELTEKVTGSLMASGRGMVTVNRYVFGEQDTPDGEGHLSKLGNSYADQHLHQLCRNCHLGRLKGEPAPIDERSRGGGCTACHLAYSVKGKEQLARYRKEDKLPSIHPSLTVKVDNRHCFGCHSRSARISTNYEGWHETLLTGEEVKDWSRHRKLQDGRIFEKKHADIHHRKGLECIDCHTIRDLMGDGKTWQHQEDQVEISCGDCHYSGIPKTMSYNELDVDSKKVLKLRKWNVENYRFLAAEKSGKPYLNVFQRPGGRMVLRGKLSGREHPLNPPKPVCGRSISGHERLNCQSCHTSWAPSCVGCHTEYRKKPFSLNIFASKKKHRPFKEYKAAFLAPLPALGVRIDRRRGDREIIDTFIPGMVMTFGGFSDEGRDSTMVEGKKYQIFRRLYAPTFSHTIVKKGRSCESCHSDSYAVGAGDGSLTYTRSQLTGRGTWLFAPKFASHKDDGLPFDAWTGFLKTRTADASTRTGARPLSGKEQREVLRVGACLTCHPYNQANRQKIYRDFQGALKRRRPPCSRE